MPEKTTTADTQKVIVPRVPASAELAQRLKELEAKVQEILARLSKQGI